MADSYSTAHQSTARSQGLVSCRYCHTLSTLPDSYSSNHGRLRCPCCHAPLFSRLPNSLKRTWSLLIASAILYIPANLLPVMTVIYQGRGQPDTMMSGVKSLIASGMWPLAAIVFVASIMVPMLKLIVFSGLLISIQMRWQKRPRDRTRLYRIMELIGRWSMVDIFVIALLVALVQFGNTASIHPGIGSLSFGAVVVLTMFAAYTFDPRLIWDNLEDQHV